MTHETDEQRRFRRLMHDMDLVHALATVHRKIRGYGKAERDEFFALFGDAYVTTFLDGYNASMDAGREREKLPPPASSYSITRTDHPKDQRDRDLLAMYNAVRWIASEDRFHGRSRDHNVFSFREDKIDPIWTGPKGRALLGAARLANGEWVNF